MLKGEILRYERPQFELLETLRFDPVEGIFLLDEHLQRLGSSADYFGYVFDEEIIRKQLLGVSSDTPLRLRLLLSASGNTRIEKFALTPSGSVFRLKLASQPVDSRDVFLFHKTTNRKVYEGAMAGMDDCDDVILWNERDELTETTICNLFLEIEGELLTPPQSSGLLAGTYRQHLLQSGRAREALLVKSDLDKADRIFVANSVRELILATLV